MLNLGNFHWLNLAGNMVAKVGDIHMRDGDSPFKRDMQGVANSLNHTQGVPCWTPSDWVPGLWRLDWCWLTVSGRWRLGYGGVCCVWRPHITHTYRNDTVYPKVMREGVGRGRW